LLFFTKENTKQKIFTTKVFRFSNKFPISSESHEMPIQPNWTSVLLLREQTGLSRGQSMLYPEKSGEKGILRKINGLYGLWLGVARGILPRAPGGVETRWRGWQFLNGLLLNSCAN